jgi:hypothetical protein
MALYNRSRYVTGLSDISYIKEVNRVQKVRRQDQVDINAPKNQPLVVRQPLKITDTFVKETFDPADIPDPNLE